MPKTVRFHQLGGPEVLQVEDLPMPEPGPGEVRLRVEAVGVNRAELLFTQGRYLLAPEVPSLIGYDAAGAVDKLGPEDPKQPSVERLGLKLGQRVHSIPTFSAAKYGVSGEYAVLPLHAIRPTPESVTPTQAVAAGVQYMTVVLALTEAGRLQAGQSLLATAASSSTGLGAIQVAKLLGARVIATTRTSAKRRALLEAGADAVIVTDEQDLTQQVQKLTDGAGVSMIFDPVGGPMMEAFAACVAPLGQVIIYGLLEPSAMSLPPIDLMVKCFSVRGFQVFNYTGGPQFDRDEAAVRRASDFIHRHMAEGTLRPKLAKVFQGLEQLPEAHRFMASNEQIGKIVVQVA